MKVGANLYKKMLMSQEEYKKSYMELNDKIQEFFRPICDRETSRIRVDEYNFVIVRVTKKFISEVIEKFSNDFDVLLLWEQEEHITDYRNSEATEVTVYEYGFGPAMLLPKIKGDDDD